jgi:pantoate--beta-alanine ligase
VSAIYPEGHRTSVSVQDLGDGLCGAKRPGHFDGVCTVVSKLFNMVGPAVAFFGEKDYQQLQIIKQMTRDLDFPIEVLSGPTIREPDGLAMSSRNAYLTPEHRRQATCLNRGLTAIADAARKAPLPASRAVQIAKEIVEAENDARIDYLEIRHSGNLQPSDQVGLGQSVVAIAVFFGSTRLIDNRVI